MYIASQPDDLSFSDFFLFLYKGKHNFAKSRLRGKRDTVSMCV